MTRRSGRAGAGTRLRAPRRDVEAAVGQRAARRLGLHRGHVRLQHLQVVQPAERVLRALERDAPARRPTSRRRRPRAPVRSAASWPRSAPGAAASGAYICPASSIAVGQRLRRASASRGAERVAPRLATRRPGAPRRPTPAADRASSTFTLLEPLEHHRAPRVALLDHAARGLLRARDAAASVARASSSSSCSVTSSSRTVPSACVSRRILPPGLAAPSCP